MSLYWLLLVGMLFFSCGGGNYQEIKYHDDGGKSMVIDYESGKKFAQQHTIEMAWFVMNEHMWMVANK